MEKLSVLIPCFNASAYLEATLQSALRNLDEGDEVVLVDDHSTDNSITIARRFLSKAKVNYTIATNPRKGACAARNHAFAISKGQWIQWLDADDLLAEFKVKRGLELILNDSNKISACPWRSFTNNIQTEKLQDDVNWNNIPLESTPGDWLSQDTFMVPHCYLGHRDLFEASGPWDESLTINQDGEYFARVIAQSSGVLFTRETEVYYRRNSSNSVSRFKPTKAQSLYHSIESLVHTALSLEDSERMRQMAANRWQHFIYTVYPHQPGLIKAAESKILELPAPNISNPNAVSPLSRAISKSMGWKTLTLLRILRSKIIR